MLVSSMYYFIQFELRHALYMRATDVVFVFTRVGIASLLTRASGWRLRLLNSHLALGHLGKRGRVDEIAVIHSWDFYGLQYHHHTSFCILYHFILLGPQFTSSP